jgi:hypothetical protein
LAVVLVLHRHPLVYATPETESPFFKTYSAEPATNAFISERHVSAMSTHEGAAAGEISANHEKGFDYHFVIQRQNWMPLMRALASDIAEKLRESGAEVVDASGDPRQGFRFQYTSGNSVGNAEIAPLDIPDPSQTPPFCLRANETTVRLRVTIREEWFKTKPGLIRISIQSHTF